MVLGRRPPKIMPLIGTPAGLSHWGSMLGHCCTGAVKRLLRWAAGAALDGFQGSPRQSIRPSGGSSVNPSHHTSLSGVKATFVKIVFRDIAAIAFGFDFGFVPGATPKKPHSGLIARRRPSSAGQIHAMSSPTSVAFQPS